MKLSCGRRSNFLATHHSRRRGESVSRGHHALGARPSRRGPAAPLPSSLTMSLAPATAHALAPAIVQRVRKTFLKTELLGVGWAHLYMQSRLPGGPTAGKQESGMQGQERWGGSIRDSRRRAAATHRMPSHPQHPPAAAARCSSLCSRQGECVPAKGGPARRRWCDPPPPVLYPSLLYWCSIVLDAKTDSAPTQGC